MKVSIELQQSLGWGRHERIPLDIKGWGESLAAFAEESLDELVQNSLEVFVK